MESKFSGALRLDNLDDFISPGQECIKPVQSDKPATASRKGVISIDSLDGSYKQVNEDGSTFKLQKAKISLDDCLACSGCVTSAESVLISEQSVDELRRVMANNAKYKEIGKDCHVKTIVVSISPQSRASIAVKYGMDLATCTRKLCGLFKHHFDARYVFDTTFSRDFSLMEGAREFIDSYKKHKLAEMNDVDLPKLPILTSACPGWICYAEKTHGALVLPHISRVKSPQQVMGSLVKDYLCKRIFDTTPDKLYHVSVMPCYDKKLEASRKDFYSEFHQSRDVDVVLSTIEIEQLLEREGLNLSDMVDENMDLPYSKHSLQLSVQKDLETQLSAYTHSGGGSGGYMEYVLVNAAKELFGQDLSPNDIVYKQLRNADFKETQLLVNGEVKLRFALAYGFRNIQNVVQKMKKGGCTYDYVEIMACPSGCLNGGGQLRDDSNTLSKELLQQVESAYYSVDAATPSNNVIVQRLYGDEWLQGDATTTNTVLRTKYHEVPKVANAITIKW